GGGKRQFLGSRQGNQNTGDHQVHTGPDHIKGRKFQDLVPGEVDHRFFEPLVHGAFHGLGHHRVDPSGQANGKTHDAPGKVIGLELFLGLPGSGQVDLRIGDVQRLFGEPKGGHHNDTGQEQQGGGGLHLGGKDAHAELIGGHSGADPGLVGLQTSDGHPDKVDQVVSGKGQGQGKGPHPDDQLIDVHLGKGHQGIGQKAPEHQIDQYHFQDPGLQEALNGHALDDGKGTVGKRGPPDALDQDEIDDGGQGSAPKEGTYPFGALLKVIGQNGPCDPLDRQAHDEGDHHRGKDPQHNLD